MSRETKIMWSREYTENTDNRGRHNIGVVCLRYGVRKDDQKGAGFGHNQLMF